MTHCSKCHRWIDHYGDYACKCTMEDLRNEIEECHQTILSLQNTFGWLKKHLVDWKKADKKSKCPNALLAWLEERNKK